MSKIDNILKKILSTSPLSSEEISILVNAYTANRISDSHMILWLKYIMENGMTPSETLTYTKTILNSGIKLDFSHLTGYVIDKHSTGGVGDKISFVLGPILAACGCYIPMVAGRGLGHTGGTIDKLETIPGYNCKISIDKFIQIVEKIGISIISQTTEICPADGKIYALRDISNTIASFPLICGSIMSKKIAEGVKGLILDIKIGNGAFMETLQEAKELGEILKITGMKYGIEVYPAITNMDEPLGITAGNWCEIKESIECLKGNGPKDVMEVVNHLGEKALGMSGEKNPLSKIKKVVENGSALKKFKEMISAHGGDIDSLNDNTLHIAENSYTITANQNGYISKIDTLNLGNALVEMGAGRKKISDIIDPTAGFAIHVKKGNLIKKGDKLLTLFCSSLKKIKIASKMIDQSIEISSKSPKLSPLIIN